MKRSCVWPPVGAAEVLPSRYKYAAVWLDTRNTCGTCQVSYLGRVLGGSPGSGYEAGVQEG